MTLRTILFFVSLALFSCSKNAELRNSVGVLEKVSKQFSDSSQIGVITDIELYKNRYYLADHTRGQILEVDENHRLVAEYGRIGDRRGELRGIQYFTIEHDSIFAVNDGLVCFELFTKPDTVSSKTIYFPQKVRPAVRQRMLRQNGIFYLSVPTTGHAILAFDQHNNSVAQFGELLAEGSKVLPSILNTRYVLSGGEHRIISVADVKPLVELFDDHGKLLCKADLSLVGPVAQAIAEDAKWDKPANSANLLFNDACFFNGKLYLLSMTGGEHAASNTLIECLVKDTGIEVIRTITLPGLWYKSVYVNGSSVLAYEGSLKQLQTIKL